jgi:hypothetical protein
MEQYGSSLFQFRDYVRMCVMNSMILEVVHRRSVLASPRNTMIA